MAKLRIILSIFVLAVVIVLPTGAIEANHQPQALEPSVVANITANTNPGEYSSKQVFSAVSNSATTCHFGIAVVNTPLIPFTGYDLSTLGVGNYLDWGRNRNSSVPSNIDYYNVLNVSDSAYTTAFLGYLPGLISSRPGETWLVGNEPDSEVTYQDHISAETYGDRYYAMAKIIRNTDPTAKIVFGTVIQSTPIRLHYLTLAMNELAVKAGDLAQAHLLIDIYSIHAFILNEQPLYDYTTNPPTNINWGAGVPVGYDAATWPSQQVINVAAGETYKTYDINIFEQGVIAFRQWMKDQGQSEQNKPLWITEYGSLFPSASNIYLQVSDADTANYMVQTFDFMLGHTDSALGYPGDNNRLVQKWDWYSLNQQLDVFGGSFFNPVNHVLTPVGLRFLQYEPSLTAVPVANPDVYVQANTLSITAFSPSSSHGLVNYNFSLKFGNNFSGDRSTGVEIMIYDGDPSVLANRIYNIQTTLLRCGGSFDASFLYNNQTPGSSHTFTATINLITGNGVDTNLTNNTYAFGSTIFPPLLTFFFPVVHK